MRRAFVFVLLVGCTPGKTGSDSIAVAPKAVVAKPIEIIGDGNAGGGDVAPFELAVGTLAFCARLEGKVWCGRGIDDDPIVHGPPIGNIDDATSIAVAPDFACLTTRRGTVHCWGSNASGQLGAKLREDRVADPVQVAGVTNAKRVFLGDDHACASTNDGALYCWGLNLSGETGGSTSWAQAARELVTPSVVAGVKDVVTVAMSYRTTCALTAKREVFCWGTSINGEQQTAQGQQNENAFRFASLAKSEDLSAGAGAFCTVRGGEVYCLGSTYALVKDREGMDRDRPSKVAMQGATKIRVGGSHACVLGRDARVSCWGYNSSGELGREETYDPDRGYEAKDPQPVPGLPNARDIAIGRATSCAITGPEEAWCWGMWPYGTASGGAAQRIERSPIRVRVR